MTDTKMDLPHILAEHRKWRMNEGGSRAYLSGAYLSRADLSGADLSGAYLSGADLSRADLSRADLSGADLSRAYLSGADLSGADLSGADLSGAYLSGAYLSGADLSRAYLSGAYLSGAYLSGVKTVIILGFPNDWPAFAYLHADGVMRIKIGCQHKTLAEGRKYWAGKNDRREVMAALDYAEAVAKLRGWNMEAAT
jgi:hypothetical protein